MAFIDATLKSGEFADLSEDFRADLVAAFIVMREAALQAMMRFAETGDQAHLMADLEMERIKLTPATLVGKTLDPGGKEGGRGILGKLARLKERFGWEGGSIDTLFSKIFKRNAEEAAPTAAEIARDKYKDIAGRKLVLPETNDILRRAKLDILKSGSKGKAISEHLRRRMQSDVREILHDANLTGTRGRAAGRVAESTIQRIRERWDETLGGYTSRSPEYASPKHVETLVNTEVRRIVNETRNGAALQFDNDNDGETFKEWRHNPALSKKIPRQNHADISGQRQRLYDPFRLTAAAGGKYFPMHPHDGILPPGEVVNCHCDVVYIFVPRKKNASTRSTEESQD